MEVNVYSKENMPKSQLLKELSEFTINSSNASSVLKSKIPLIVPLILVLRRVAYKQCVALEEYLRKIGLLQGYHSKDFVNSAVVRSQSSFENFFTKEKHYIFAVLDGDKVIGISCMEPARESGMAYFHTTHVDPGYRRHGLGSSLALRMINKVKEENYKGVLAIGLVESQVSMKRLGFIKQKLDKRNRTYLMKLAL